MTAHLLAILLSLLPIQAPTNTPTPDQLTKEAQKRANEFCTPDYVYPAGMVPWIVRCQQTVPDCDSKVNHDDKYIVRCQARI